MIPPLAVCPQALFTHLPSPASVGALRRTTCACSPSASLPLSLPRSLLLLSLSPLLLTRCPLPAATAMKPPPCTALAPRMAARSECE
jgi:hypothetical protein